ncbi:hypothetical protein J4E81_009932 [Alternaria sp. BMP 2799]|nr:hypothetical protein J4E81_009932 [Alternaria sp. BMP 2799]
MSSVQPTQLGAVQDDESATGQDYANVVFLQHHLAGLSVEKMHKNDYEIFEEVRDRQRRTMKRPFSLPSSDKAATFEVPEDLALSESSWINANVDNLEDAPTKQYSPAIVKIVANSFIDLKYSLPDDLPANTTATEMHMQVYFCATDMGMPGLQDFAFKFMGAALSKAGLTPGQLKNLVEHHHLFTEDFCKKALTVPQYQNVMYTFATYIVAHKDDFDGNVVYGDVFVPTRGHLSVYLNNVHAGVKSTMEAIKKGTVGLNKRHRRRASQEPYGRGRPSSRRLIETAATTPSRVPVAASSFQYLDDRLLDHSVEGHDSSLTPRPRFRELEDDDANFTPHGSSNSPMRPVKDETDQEAEEGQTTHFIGEVADDTGTAYVTASQGIISSDNGGQPQPPPPQAGDSAAVESKDTAMSEAPQLAKKDTATLDPPKSGKKDTTMLNNTTMSIGSPGPGS